MADGRTATTPASSLMQFRPLREIVETDQSYEASAIECLRALDLLPPDDLARPDYRAAAQTFALLSIGVTTQQTWPQPLFLVERFEAAVVAVEKAVQMRKMRPALVEYDVARAALLEALRGN